MGSFSTLPNDCNSALQNTSRRLQGTFNPACDPGTCGAIPPPSPPSPTPPSPPSPTPPSPTPPSPTPPSPSPGAHCDQCSTLVLAQCGDFIGQGPGLCQGCAWNHAQAWFPMGCQLPGCGKEVADACAPQSPEVVV